MIVSSTENALSINHPFRQQNGTGTWRRRQDERARTISHQITGAQGNTFGKFIDQRNGFNIRFVSFNRTGCIRRATGIHYICSGYQQQMLYTCSALTLSSEIVNWNKSPRSPLWSRVSTGKRGPRKLDRYVKDSKITSAFNGEGLEIWRLRRYTGHVGLPSSFAATAVA